MGCEECQIGFATYYSTMDPAAFALPLLCLYREQQAIWLHKEKFKGPEDDFKVQNTSTGLWRPGVHSDVGSSYHSEGSVNWV